MSINELSAKDVEVILEEQKRYFHTQATKDLDFRINQLRLLKKAIKEYEKQILEALNIDLGKHKNEGYMTAMSLS